MPAADLFLNAAAPAPGRTLEGQSYFAGGQAYVMVAVQDDKGGVIPGGEGGASRGEKEKG